jgi:hypothetical protein
LGDVEKLGYTKAVRAVFATERGRALATGALEAASVVGRGGGEGAFASTVAAADLVAMGIEDALCKRAVISRDGSPLAWTVWGLPREGGRHRGREWAVLSCLGVKSSLCNAASGLRRSTVAGIQGGVVGGRKYNKVWASTKTRVGQKLRTRKRKKVEG